jgi:DNA-binding GntR family transcriptional regulator
MPRSHNSLHDEVAERLRGLIFSGDLTPGQWVNEVLLCETWDISRTPMREALKVLSAEGLVRHEPRRGCFVNEVTEQDLDEIFPVIALLEGRCAHEAACHASDSDLMALATLHDQLQAHAQAGRIPDYYATNYTIHESIIAMAGNKWLAMAIGDLRKILKLARLQQLNAPGRLAQSLSEHLAIFSALKDRNALAAEEAMRIHLTRQREALRSLMQSQSSRLSGLVRSDVNPLNPPKVQTT